MASSSSSPLSNNNKVGDSVTTATVTNGSATTPQRSVSFDTPRPNQRGLNKPKCVKCGNVARSRCPYSSCKSCCAKAQNPCRIHVLKDSSILPDKPPPSTTTLFEPPSPDVPSKGASWRLSSLRQLSSTYANSMRVKKPLTRKDAVNLNKWRFSKLKEHFERDIEAENEAFERYMHNVRLLEETFSIEGLNPDDEASLEDTSEEKMFRWVSTIKVKLKSNAERAADFREKIRKLVDEKLRKLQDREIVGDGFSAYANDLDTNRALRKPMEGEWLAERSAVLSDLVDKLSKARTEDDLKSCLEMKRQLFNQSKSMVIDTSSNGDAENPLMPKEEPDVKSELQSYSPPRACNLVHMDEESASKINAELSSVSQLVELV